MHPTNLCTRICCAFENPLRGLFPIMAYSHHATFPPNLEALFPESLFEFVSHSPYVNFDFPINGFQVLNPSLSSKFSFVE